LVKLKRQLGLMDVFAVAAGAMISSGLFVLPGLAYAKAGPAMIFSYLIASILVLPSVFSKAELATAMPKAGGTYFYVERSLGSVWGLFSGFANWFSLALKSAFAIVGMAVFVKLFGEMVFDSELGAESLKLISILCCLVFMAINIISVKGTTKFQIALVALLILILTLFIGTGVTYVNLKYYAGFFDKGPVAIFSTAGLVFISFGGITKIASIAEEVHHPGKNLPLGMFLAWFIVSLFYLAVIFVTVGVFEGEKLAASYAPISQAAQSFMGMTGFAILSVAAMAAFVTTANGGILAASRSPLAMSRDSLLPSIFAKVTSKSRTPYISILITGLFMIAALLFLKIEDLVKTASTLMIILFILDNASVIIMRESKIQSYRPRFKSPLYPYMHIIVIILYTVLIIDMGAIPLLISLGFVAMSVFWYFVYARKKSTRAAAIMHVVERVTDKSLKTVTLENELRDILLERDNIVGDRFDELIGNCEIIDVKGQALAEDILKKMSAALSSKLDVSEYVLFEKFLYREQQGSTVVQPGFAIPHVIVDGQHKFEILLVRAIEGIKFSGSDDLVHTIFALAGSKDERNYHLRALMAIAQIVQDTKFKSRWLAARDVETLRNLILLSKRKRDTN